MIGAARAGTTSFYNYLRVHPQIFMPENKEPMFYAFEGQKVEFSGPGDRFEINAKSVTSINDYLQLFSAALPNQVRGEASALYFYNFRAIQNIFRHAPNTKLFIILRNPIERAYSAYLYLVRDRRESLSFDEALERENERIDAGWEHIWHYKKMGLYGQQLAQLYSVFPREQVKIYLYDDLQKDPKSILLDAFAYLGVNTDFEPNFKIKHNQGGIPNKGVVAHLFTRPSRIKAIVKPWLPESLRTYYLEQKHKRLSRPVMSSNARNVLVEHYQDDIETLERLLDRDLGSWKEGSR